MGSRASIAVVSSAILVCAIFSKASHAEGGNGKQQLRQNQRSIQRVIRLNDFEVNRGLLDYANRLSYRPRYARAFSEQVDKRLQDVKVMPLNRSLFYRYIRRLPANAVWLDVGAGWARAQQEYRAAGGKARLVALSIKKPNAEADAKDLQRYYRSRGQNIYVCYNKDQDTRMAEFERQEGQRFTYLHGKPMERFDMATLRRRVGKVDVITDVFGALSYTGQVATVLDRYARLLKTGGRMFLHIVPEGLQIQDRRGQRLDTIDWLSRIDGLKLERRLPIQLGEQRSNQVLTVVLRKTKDRVRVPRLRLADYSDDKPPVRRLELR